MKISASCVTCCLAIACTAACVTTKPDDDTRAADTAGPPQLVLSAAGGRSSGGKYVLYSVTSQPTPGGPALRSRSFVLYPGINGGN